MNKATAAALVGCLIVLIVYVGITSATLVRDIDATEAAESYAVDSSSQAAVLKQTSGPALAEKKTAFADMQSKAAHKRHDHIARHVPKVKREPIILLL